MVPSSRSDNQSNKSPSIREKTYRERNNGPRRVFQPFLEVRKRKKSNPGDKMKNSKISAELYRSKERILRKSSCGQQSKEVRMRMRKATGFGNETARGPF